ncbi:hypothetical protein Emed_006867 [Eimeria media]
MISSAHRRAWGPPPHEGLCSSRPSADRLGVEVYIHLKGFAAAAAVAGAAAAAAVARLLRAAEEGPLEAPFLLFLAGDKRRHRRHLKRDSSSSSSNSSSSSSKYKSGVSHWRFPLMTVSCSRRGPSPIVHGGPRVSSATAASVLLLLLWGAFLGTLGAVAGGPYPEPAAAAAESAGAPHDSGPSWGPSLRASLLLGGPWREQEGAFGSRLLFGPAAAAFGLEDSEEEGSLDLPMSLQTLISISFACLVGCLVSFFFLSASHLRNYYEPKLQRMVCRIGCALPLFALLSTAACFSVFSELRALQKGPLPYEALTLNNPAPPSPSPALGSSSPISSVAVQAATIASAAAAEEGAEGGLEGASKGGPPKGTVETPWLEGAPLRELSAADVLLRAPSSFSSRASPASPVLPEGSGGPSPNASKGGPLRDQDHYSHHRRPYYLQQQLFFELGKQLTQSTALYSFSSLMVNACGGYRCLSLTLGCDGHSVPYVFPLSLLLRPFLPNPKALRMLKLGVMQFVLVLPLWTAATLMADNSTSQSDSFAPKTHLRREQTIPGGEETVSPPPRALPHFRGSAASHPQTSSLEDAMENPSNAISEETIPEETIPGEGSSAVLGLMLSLSMFASMMSLSQFYLITRPYLSPYTARFHQQLAAPHRRTRRHPVGPSGSRRSQRHWLGTRHCNACNFVVVAAAAAAAAALAPDPLTANVVDAAATAAVLIYHCCCCSLSPPAADAAAVLTGAAAAKRSGVQGYFPSSSLVAALMPLLHAAVMLLLLLLLLLQDLYHNLLTNIWAFAFSLLYWRCFPVSDHVPEVDDEAISYLESPKKPSTMHASVVLCTLLPLLLLHLLPDEQHQQHHYQQRQEGQQQTCVGVLLDVCFSVDLIADAHEAVLAPQMSLDRAFSLLHQQTISHQAFLQEWTEMEDAGVLQTPQTATSPEHEREEEGGLPLPSEHTTTGAPESLGGPLDSKPASEEGPLKLEDTISEAETSRGLLRRGESRATAGTHRSYWGPRLPWGPLQSPSVTSSHLPRRMATVSVYSNSSSLHPTSAAAAAAAAALAEAATIGSYRSKRAREAARARISALACPTSPYSTDLTAALAIALGDAAPAFPVSISLLSRRLAAMSLTRSTSSSSTPAPPASPSVAPLRKWASGGPPGGLQKKNRGRGAPHAPRRSASARRLRKPSVEKREEAPPRSSQETADIGRAP